MHNQLQHLERMIVETNRYNVDSEIWLIDVIYLENFY